MSDEREAFERAVVASPDDDTVRLVYADWLDERGDPRGEFIRVQIALARVGSRVETDPGIPDPDCKNCDGGRRAYVVMIDGETCPIPCVKCWDNLRRRERELWKSLVYAGAIPPECRQGIEAFDRGFFTRWTCSWDVFRDQADVILAAQPVTEVTLTTWPDLASRPAGDGRDYWLTGADQPGKWWVHRYDKAGYDADGIVRELLGKNWPQVKTWNLPGPTGLRGRMAIGGADVGEVTVAVRELRDLGGFPGVEMGDVPVPRPCEQCGTTDDVSFDANPYAEEIHGNNTPVWLCRSCRRELALDV